jgi:hypothetical protein
MKIHGFSRADELRELNEQRELRRPSTRPPSEAPASTTRISSPGRLFSELAKLSEEDPAAFRELTQAIADELRATVGEGSERGDAITERLAARFEQAATSGKLGSFVPPRDDAGRAHHDHHPHRHHHDREHDHGHRRGPRGFGDGEVRSVLEHALDLVHEARLRAFETPPPAEASASEATLAETPAPGDQGPNTAS